MKLTQETNTGLDRIVVSTSACGADNPGSIPGRVRAVNQLEYSSPSFFLAPDAHNELRKQTLGKGGVFSAEEFSAEKWNAGGKTELGKPGFGDRRVGLWNMAPEVRPNNNFWSYLPGVIPTQQQPRKNKKFRYILYSNI